MIPEKVQAILRANGLEAIEFEAGSTPTALLAASRLGVTVGQIAKSILLKGKDDQYYLVVCPGDRKISNAKLKAAMAVKARMATPEETFERTGFRPGGVCPFGIDGVRVVLDEALAAYPVIYPAAGTDGSGVAVTFERLRAITAADVRDLTDPPGESSAS